MRHILLCILFIFTGIASYAQQIDFGNLKKEKPIVLNGGLSARSVFYSGDSNRLPFSYILTGNLGVKVLGYNFPLNFTYSNQQLNYSQPISFNKLSFHPKYKWLQMHVGSHSMSFSPYTLNGHQFTGAAVELTPGNGLKICAMYGRLLKATELLNDTLSPPSYKRMGYGVKAGYEKNGFLLEGIAFSASDNPESLLTDSIDVVPFQNMVLGVKGRFSPVKQIQLMGEVASSVINSNPNTWQEFPGKLLLNKSAGYSVYSAYKLSVGFTPGKWTFGLNFEHIDPNYQTLGAYYFTNDLENITMNMAVALLEGKLNMSVNGGLQYDDLEQQKKSSSKRMVGSYSLVYAPGEKMNINLNYSNFQSYTNIKSQFDYINQVSPYDNLDTLDFSQLSQSANLSFRYQIANTDTKREYLGVNCSIQDAKGSSGENGNTFFVNSSILWGRSGKQMLTWNASFNATFNAMGQNSNFTYGPLLTVSQGFFDKKLKAMASMAYNRSFLEKQLNLENFTMRASLNHVVNKKHRFSLTYVGVKRILIDLKRNDRTITLGYSYSF